MSRSRNTNRDGPRVTCQCRIAALRSMGRGSGAGQSNWRKVFIRILTGILTVAAVIGFHGSVLAQQAPGPDDLALALGLGMQSCWTVGAVRDPGVGE